MREYIGPRQQAIIQALLDGKELWKCPGKRGYDRWSLDRWLLDGKTVNRESCMALFLRGYLMMTTTREWCYRLELTDKGKRAVSQ